MSSPGPIALIGGGEHLAQTVPIDRRLIELTGVPKPEVVVLPQAPARAQKAKTVALARNYWSRLGARVRIALPDADIEQAMDAVAQADIAVIPGGHPNKLISRLGASPLTDLVIARWSEGMALSGSSAGAMGMFEWRINLYPPNPLRLIPALGVLDGYVAAPHFERFRATLWAHKAVPALKGLGVVGLDEMTGLVGYNTDFDVLGRGSVTVMDAGGTTVYPSGTWVPVDLLANSASRLDQEDENSIYIRQQRSSISGANPTQFNHFQETHEQTTAPTVLSSSSPPSSAMSSKAANSRSKAAISSSAGS